MKKTISILLVLSLMLVLLVPGSAFAEGETAPDHVIINQVYGGAEDGYASHSFIELYNPTGADVDLSGWSVQYRSSEDGDHSDSWNVCKLTGTIAAGGYYLIRCGAVTDTNNVNYTVPAGNQEWDIQIHNKGISVALVKKQTQLAKAVSGDITKLTSDLREAIVDLAAVQGNDTDKDTGEALLEEMPPAYETAVLGGDDGQSKKKAIRRINFADTDNNAKDFETVNYSKSVDAEKGPHGPASEPEEPDVPSYTPVETTDTAYAGYYNETAALQAALIARYNAGAMNADGGSAEIIVYNPTREAAYAVNGVKGTLDVIPMDSLQSGASVQNLNGTEIDVKALVEGEDAGFTYGDMTSVTVSPDGTKLAVALQDADYTKAGRAAIFSYGENEELVLEKLAVTGMQPDMITFNADGSLVLTANEGEPRMGYTAEGAVDPAGSVSIITVVNGEVQTVGFESYDEQREALAAAGVVIKKNTSPSVDFEPEYIAVSGDTAYVSLQEANAIAVLDLDTKEFTGVYSIGFEDYSTTAVDLNSGDGKYEPANYDTIRGIRMPDAISTFTANGRAYLVTANEGDSRAWPVETEADVNEIKDKTSPVNRIEFDKKVTWFDTSQYDGLEEGLDYIFGGRSFTILEVTENGLKEVYDSGSDFERITAENLPDYFNCSNDNADLEDRSGKKGPEPEGITTGQVGGKTYVFIALERIGGIMIYDVTDPANAAFVNYINSRDFSADIKDDVSPEGLAFIAEGNSPTGNALLVAANEVSGTVSIYELTEKEPEAPEAPSYPYYPSVPDSGSTGADGDLADGDQTAESQNAARIEKIQGTRFTARSVMTSVNGKKAVKVYWNVPQGLELDGYQVFRSVKRYSGYGKKPFFTTEKTSYYNTAVKAGTRYYYKVRGYKEIAGEMVYTQWSYKAWRTVK